MSPTPAKANNSPETAKVALADGVNGREERPRDPWTAIELRHMAALEALATKRSFRGAADELGYVQSAVSQQLFALERVIGARLVDRERGHKPVSLTPAGELLLEHIEAITARLAFARRELEALSAGHAGLLRIGVNSDIGPSVLPSLTRAMARQWPEIALELTELSSDAESLALLEDTSLDASFVFSVPAGISLQGEGVLRDRFVLLAGEDSPLAAASPLTGLDPLVGAPLIVTKRGAELAQLEAGLAGLGLKLGPIVEVGSRETAIALALAGEGRRSSPASSSARYLPGWQWSSWASRRRGVRSA